MLLLKRTYTILLSFALVVMCAGALHATEVRVLPASSTVAVNSTFALTVSADEAADLGGFQFNFSYDSAVLSVSGISVNNAFDLPVLSQFDNTAGTGSVAASVYGAPALSGAHLPLAIITFTVKAPGSANIGLTNTILGKIGGEEIPSTTAGGAVTGTAGFTISSQAGSNGAILPSGTVLVNLESSQTFTIVPDNGYRIADVLVDGISQGVVTGYTFTNVAASHMITASFMPGDATPPVFSSTAPASGSFVNTAVVGYDLSEAVASGSISFTWTGGALDALSPYVHSLTMPDMTAGSHSIDTGLALASGAVYSVIFSATDLANNTGTIINSSVTYDNTAAAVTITSPLPNAWVNTSNVSYTLSEAVTAGRIVLMRIGGATDVTHAYAFTTPDMTLGAHSVNLGTLVQGAVYAVSINNVADSAGNSTAPVTNENITFDAQSVSITNTSPTRKGIITEAAIGYTLSEDAQTGKATFTRTNGSADADSPHVFTFTTTDLTSGAHTIKTGLSLVDGAYYTVSFEAIDKASNPATTISNAQVFVDSTYAAGPIGNVDNTGASMNKVDAADVLKMTTVMNSRPGDPRWNPVCDLDHNNVIDGSDLMILEAHFGESR